MGRDTERKVLNKVPTVAIVEVVLGGQMQNEDISLVIAVSPSVIHFDSF